MAELTRDTRAQDVVEHVRLTLADATVNGERVFQAVRVYRDQAAFTRQADALAGIWAGVIARPVEIGPPADNGDAHTVRLTLDVLVRFSAPRGPGEDERVSADEMVRLAGLVRQALSIDRNRGGLCHAIVWSGSVLDGTEFKGQPRLVTSRANQSFVTASVPVVCGWAVERKP